MTTGHAQTGSLPRPTPQIRDFPFARESPVELSAQMRDMREHDPVAQVRLPSGQLVWLVTRYEDVKIVLSDARFSMAAATAEDAPELSPKVKVYPALFSLDPPLHSQVRRLFTRALHAQSPVHLRETITRLANELVDTMTDHAETADLVADFYEPLVTQVAVELLGVTPALIADFRRHFAMMLDLTEASTGRAVEEAKAIGALVSSIVQERRAHPSDDMFGRIVASFDEDGTIPGQNLVGLGAHVLSSTANPVALISHAAVCLLRHQDQWKLLTQRPDLLASAVNECIRYSAPVEVEHLRITMEDVEIGGVPVPRGSAVMTSVAAANRDPSIFEHAEKFDITRTPNRHLAFGYGPHVCAGASVGDALLGGTLTILSTRLPGLHLAVPESELFLRNDHSHILAMGSAPVTW